jgi:hypothetical protein
VVYTSPSGFTENSNFYKVRAQEKCKVPLYVRFEPIDCNGPVNRFFPLTS